ncbi:MAG: tetratricopeptide repeat protein [Promethearchaeota archaeon]
MSKFNKKLEKQYENDLMKARKLISEGNYQRAKPLFLKVYKFYKKKKHLARAFYALEGFLDILLQTGGILDHLSKLDELYNYGMEIGDTQIQSSALYYKGLAFKHVDLKKAENFFLEYLQIAHKLKDYYKIVIGLLNVGYVYQSQGYYEKALDLFLKAKELCFKYDLKKLFSSVFGALGLIHKYFQQYKKFDEYYELALDYIEYVDDPRAIAIIISNSLAKVSVSELDDKKLLKIERLLDYCDQYNLNEVKTAILTNLGNYYISNGEIEKGKNLLEQASILSDKFELITEKIDILHSLGFYSIKNRDFIKSIAYFQESIPLAKKLRNQFQLIRAYKALGLIYKEKEDFHESYRNYTQALFSYQAISKQFISVELRESFEKVFLDLPEIINEINCLLESRRIKPNIIELEKSKKISIESCKEATNKFENLSREELIHQIKRFSKNIDSIKGDLLENDARLLFEKRDYYKMDLTGPNWELEPSEINVLYDENCLRDKNSKTIELDLKGEKLISGIAQYILGEAKYRNKPINNKEIKCFLLKANVIASHLAKVYQKEHGREPSFHLIIVSLGGFPKEHQVDEFVSKFWKLPKNRIANRRVELIAGKDFVKYLKENNISSKNYRNI